METKPQLLLNIKDLAGKSLKEISQILGQAESTEKLKGYPCQNSNCEKAIFQNGKYEIIFKNGNSTRITINETTDLTSDKKAIQTLGLQQIEPSFKNPGTVMRWSNIEGIHEINFFTNYILVIIEPADEK